MLCAVKFQKMKNNNCFYCLNQCKGQLAENTGWYHPCKLGIQNEGLQNVKECPSYSPNTGFQIGGYYSHIHFEYNKENANECMEMIIHSDGEFPTEETERQIQFHICDFRQLEHFVKEWGEYFRKIGVVSDSD